MAAPSASILSFVIFIITISSSCYASVALAVPKTGEVAFPSQSIISSLPIIGGILNPPSGLPIIGGILNPPTSLPIIGGILNPPTILPNTSSLLPQVNLTIVISLSAGRLLPNINLLNLTLPIVALPNTSLPGTSLPNIPLPNVTLPNITLPNITLPNATAIPPLGLNINVTVPGFVSLGFNINILNGILSGLLQALGLGGNGILPILSPLPIPNLPSIP